MRSFYLLSILSLLVIQELSSQLAPDCQLEFGTNMAGMADWGTELPFVDLMHNAREWYTRDVGNPNAAFNSGNASLLSLRTDGYPTHAPQTVAGSSWPQEILTIWGSTLGWPAGQYVLIWEGTGQLRVQGSLSNPNFTGPNRMTFDLLPQEQGIVEIAIESSDINDPIRNMRLLMPGTEFTYEQQPFNPTWLDKLLTFETVRFMDWGQTNHWDQEDGANWDIPNEADWSERAQMNHYTWAHRKGIPYEMMVRLMNDYDLDGWLCVPHRASPEFLDSIATFFRDNLEPERHLYVEYSNEIWNWIFGQTHWLNQYGCINTGTSWPEGIVPYIQRCMDAFGAVFAGQEHRITRVVGTQLSWVDVSQRIVNNMTPGSFEAVSPTCYFGFSEEGDEALDLLGPAATAADVAFYASQAMPANFAHVRDQQEQVADPLGLPMIFYEGGQHLTPHPFGVEPSYAQALLDVQRDPAMFDLYQNWFDSLRSLQTGDEALKIMHFGFVAHRSAQYGSWGMLETMDQDTNQIYAPKYSAVLQNMAGPECQSPLAVDWGEASFSGHNCDATIEWTTQREVDNSHFELYRSNNGRDFTQLDIIPADNLPQGSHYVYQDAFLPRGDYYYRIDQLDFDGSRSSLGVFPLTVNCPNDPLALKLFPNPVHDQLRLSLNTLAGGRIVVFSSQGQQILANEVARLDDSRLLTSQLTSGVYLLVVYPDDGGPVLRGRFVKE